MQRWPSLKQLQYLVALDEHKNFNRAAKACHVSQSTLSTGIQTLEDMMNLQLVERDHKSFIMTRSAWKSSSELAICSRMREI